MLNAYVGVASQVRRPVCVRSPEGSRKMVKPQQSRNVTISITIRNLQVLRHIFLGPRSARGAVARQQREVVTRQDAYTSSASTAAQLPGSPATIHLIYRDIPQIARSPRHDFGYDILSFNMVQKWLRPLKRVRRSTHPLQVSQHHNV